MKKILTITSFALIALAAKAQVKIGNNPNTVNPNAVLDLESTNKGILYPRVALVATTNPAPLTAHVQGMVVYNTATTADVVPGLYENDGTKWRAFAVISYREAAVVTVQSNGFTGDFSNGTGARTISVTVTNNSFSPIALTPSVADLVLNPASGLTVDAVSPNTLTTINSGESLTLTFTLGGTLSAPIGTVITGNFEKLSLSASSTVTVGNSLPVASAGPNQTINLPGTTSATLTGSGSDADGPVTYNWAYTGGTGTATPVIASPTAATTNVTGLNTDGTYIFTLTVTDNAGASTQSTVTVTASSNTAPTANAGSLITINQPSSSTTISGSGSDPDGYIASYNWAFTPGGTGTSTPNISNPSSASTAVSGLTGPGTYFFTLTVTDNNGATAQAVKTVRVNKMPTANAGSAQSIALPQTSFTLSGSGTDTDGSVSSYLWTKTGGSGTSVPTITSANSASTTVTNITTPGSYIFTLKVTDNNGATSTATVTITFTGPPVAIVNGPGTTKLTFMAHNLGVDTSLDPMVMQQNLHGAKYRWGTKVITQLNSDTYYSGTQVANASPNPYSFTSTTYWNSGTEANPVKTNWDPCPTGFRVPTITELQALYSTSNGNTLTFEGPWQSTPYPSIWNASVVIKSNGVIKLKLPAAGYQQSNGQGYRGSYADYWSSSVYTQNTQLKYAMHLTPALQTTTTYGVISPSDYYLPVRCIKQ